MKSSRPEHPWHLSRCSACRQFVINSAPQCPNCGEWRASARAVKIAIPAIGWIAAIAGFVLVVQFALKLERQRQILQELAIAGQYSE